MQRPGFLGEENKPGQKNGTSKKTAVFNFDLL